MYIEQDKARVHLRTSLSAYLTLCLQYRRLDSLLTSEYTTNQRP
jgi:hypothetical protein